MRFVFPHFCTKVLRVDLVVLVGQHEHPGMPNLA